MYNIIYVYIYIYILYEYICIYLSEGAINISRQVQPATSLFGKEKGRVEQRRGKRENEQNGRKLKNSSWQVLYLESVTRCNTLERVGRKKICNMKLLCC